MGFWDFLTRRDPVSIAALTPNVTYIGGDDVSGLSTLLDPSQLTVTQLWQSQPHLRTVVSFLARNVAQLGVHVFERDGDSRVRDRASAFAQLMRRPNPEQTAYDLIYSLVGDLALYDRAYWLLGVDSSAPSGWTVRRLPPPWVSPVDYNAFAVTRWQVRGLNGQTVEIPAEDLITFGGYHPANPREASPTVETLRQTLQEQVEAAKFRAQIWKRGGRVSSIIERPKDAPEWSPEAMEQFRQDWYAKYTGSGSMAGGTPILEDGMTLKRIDFTAAEQQWVEAAKLALSTVASAFHINPTMVGVLDNANYSNVREFRRMLYGDSLGPLIAQIEDRINTFVLPKLGMDNAQFYVEFNIAEKLQGSFEEQAAVMSTLVGRPIFTADEGRALFNRPAIGGDAAQLVTPLNVLVGGQASPRDSAPPKAGRPRLKAAPSDPQQEKAAQVVGKFFTRQQSVVLSRINAGADWWDGERWDRELAADLLPLAHSIAETIGKAEAKRLGFTAGDYDADRTVEFLKAVAERHAKAVNETTREQLTEAVRDEDGDPAHVFEVAKEARAPGVATIVATFAAGFATVEAAKQIAETHDVAPTKTWVTGPNPRPEHAAMDGQTVPIDEPFSDGNDWPGGLPGCNCSVIVDIP